MKCKNIIYVSLRVYYMISLVTVFPSIPIVSLATCSTYRYSILPLLSFKQFMFPCEPLLSFHPFVHLPILPSSLPATNISSIVSLYPSTNHPYVLPFHFSPSLYPFPLSSPRCFIPVASTMPSRITTISNSSFSICAIVISQKGLLWLIS